jgi:predicted RNA-binding protein with PUA-like domain
MVLTQKGMRLSIQPVKEKHFKKIIQLAAQA